MTDDALRLWLAFFMRERSTLRFGGDNAGMEITPRARVALDELIGMGAVQTVPADDQWPNREHYGSTGLDLRPELLARPHLNPFTDTEEFISFRKKEPRHD